MMDRPFVVSLAPTLMPLSRFLAVWSSLFLSLWQGTFEWFPYTAFHGPSEIDFSLGEGVGGEMR